MLRKRRQKEKKASDEVGKSLPTAPEEKNIQKTGASFSITEIAREYNDFIRNHLPEPEKKSSSEFQRRYAEELMANNEQFYRIFRAPLTVLTSFFQLIETNLKEITQFNKRTKIMKDMLSSTQYELHNIENLLVYLWLVWSLETPKIKINLQAAVHKELSAVSSLFSARRIKIFNEIDPSMGAMCSPELFSLCIKNLLSNVVEYGKPNSELVIQAAASHYRTRSNVDIILEHSVESVDLKTIRKAFDLFFTTKSTRIGIGLSLCREILSAMNGTISMKKLPGPSVQTKIVLPL